jgi:ABC-2 type transport system permease protein
VSARLALPETAAPAGRCVQAARFLARAWLLEMRQLMQSRIYLFVALFFPLIFACIAFYMFRGSARPGAAIDLALSAGLMGMWSTTLLGSGNAITRLRYMAVLEPLVASPRSTFLVTLPFAVATASLGIYSLLATLIWSALLFDMPLHLAHPGLFAVAVPVTVVALGLLGLLLASAFILYPTAQSLANLFEYPVWMLSGMLVPLSALPGGLQAVSHVLAPTWGVKAVLGSATGAGDALPAIAMCVLLSVVYVATTLLLLKRFEWLARASGSLALQ